MPWFRRGHAPSRPLSGKASSRSPVSAWIAASSIDGHSCDLVQTHARRALEGRLAVDRRWGGRGLGPAPLADAFRRVVRASEALAVYAIIVDAKDAQTRAFYERFGFVRLPDAGQRLFHPVASAERLIGG